jgi:hypothetical protein
VSYNPEFEKVICSGARHSTVAQIVRVLRLKYGRWVRTAGSEWGGAGGGGGTATELGGSVAILD